MPSANTTDSTYTNQTSITAYDNLGNAVNLNVYFTNTGNNTWEVDVYKAADATNGGFPYQKTTAGVTTTDTPLVTQTLTFSPTTGDLTSPTALTISIPNGQTLNLNIAQMTQLASSFSISNSTVNGNSPATFQNVSIATDGTLSEVYSNGTTVPVYKIPLFGQKSAQKRQLSSLSSENSCAILPKCPRRHTRRAARAAKVHTRDPRSP